jgi:hypothetical protein
VPKLAAAFVLTVPASLLAVGCISYGPRVKVTDDGQERCYRQMYANPPSQADVSCSAEVRPPEGDSEWCTVEAVSGEMIELACDE